MPVRFIAVEGPPCVGKTELARALGDRLDARQVLEDAEENPFLPLFYEEPEHYSFQTQAFFLLSRYRRQQDLHQIDLFQSLVVSNYIIARDAVYAHVVLNDDELILYERLAETLQEQGPRPDLVIYLQSSVPHLLRRVRSRAPEYEQLMTEGYLAQVVEAYTHFFFHYRETPLLVVNVEQADVVGNPDLFNSLLKQIASPPAGTRYYRPMAVGV